MRLCSRGLPPCADQLRVVAGSVAYDVNAADLQLRKRASKGRPIFLRRVLENLTMLARQSSCLVDGGLVHGIAAAELWRIGCARQFARCMAFERSLQRRCIGRNEGS